MAIITVNGLTMDFGENLIFDNINFEVQSGDKIGLIGANGCGKTTLLKLLIGEYQSSKGSIIINKNTKIGYMEQHVCRNLERSAYNEVMTVFDDLIKMEDEIDILNGRIGASYGNLSEMVERQAFLHDEFTRRGGLTCRSRARAALLGLGFDDTQMGLPISSLSGGQRAKLQLAKLLLCEANFLLLDEPTNHLDTQSVEWLEDYLVNFGRAYIVISHDRYFLDKTTNKTYELENKKLTSYKGNYSLYLPQKEERRLAEQRVYDNTMKEINRLEAVVEQQRRWNREKNIKTAESKLKVIDRLEKGIKKPDSAPSSIKLTMNIKEQSGDDVLKVDNLSLGFNGSILFENVSLEIHRGERIFILGPNGCGKTSFLKTLLGKYKSNSGRIRFGEGVKIGYYDQIQQGMESEKTVFEELSDKFPHMTNTEIRSTLARFLFKNDDVFKTLSKLSGGERARVLLAELMLMGSNMLFLDEPTNHLDINSCEALQEALKNYEGTLLIVSHDRYLINNLADKIYFLNPSGMEGFEGNYDDFLNKFDPFKRSEKIKEPQPEKQQDYKNKKERDSQRRKARAKITKLEILISDNEDRISLLNEKLNVPEISSDYQKTIEITEEIERIQKELDRMYVEWEELSEMVE